VQAAKRKQDFEVEGSLSHLGIGKRGLLGVLCAAQISMVILEENFEVER
jgi:hypothetical protein